jgi:hypothetical protein
MVRCHEATASSFVAKVRVEVFTHFHYKFFVNKPLDAKENDEHAIDFSLHLSHFFSLSEFVLSMYSLCFLPQRLV